MLKLANWNEQPEIFYSIQGEGPHCGRPSIFIRTAMCNLYCRWCDTDYTWNWQGTSFHHNKDQVSGYSKFDKDKYIIYADYEQIADLLFSFPCRYLILTGGEPLLQQREWLSFREFLHNNHKDYHWEVETNGTIQPDEHFDAMIEHYSVSPKLKNSGVADKQRERETCYRFFAAHARAVFKYVVENKSDVEEILNAAQKYKITHERIYLMAQGINDKELSQKQIWLVEICKQYGFHFSDRLHIRLYGDKQGV